MSAINPRESCYQLAVEQPCESFPDHPKCYSLGNATEKVYFEPISSEQQDLLDVGSDLIQKVRKIIRYCNTHPAYSFPGPYSARKNLEMMQKFYSLRGEKTDLNGRIANVCKSRMGDCLDMSLVGQKIARKEYPEYTVVVHKIHSKPRSFLFNHAFLTIDKPKSIFDDPTSHPVICDPWSGNCYPAYMESNLRVLVKYEISENRERARTIVAPFSSESYEILPADEQMT